MRLSPRYDGPSILDIERLGDPLVPVARQRRRFASMLETLTDAQWAAPSRCEGWTVQDVVAHLITVNGFWQISVTSALAGAPTRYLDGFDPAANPKEHVAPMRALSPHDVLEQFIASNEGFLGAIEGLDDTAWDTVAEAPPGDVAIHTLVAHALWDSWAHERDVALPLGFAPVEEDDEVRTCLRYSAAIGPALGLGLGLADDVAGRYAVRSTGPTDAFIVDVSDSVRVSSAGSDTHAGGQAGEVPCLSGDAVELTEALTIRVPMPSSAPAQWSGLVGLLGVAFDTPV